MEIILSLSDAQARALEIMQLSEKSETIAGAAVASAIKGKLNYYRNGSTVKTEGESTHQIIKNLKGGGTKTVYYKGGLRAEATAAYEMAKKYLPPTVTKNQFVNDQLAEVDAVIAELGAAEDENAE